MSEASGIADPAAATSTDAQVEAWVGEFIEGWRAPSSADAFADHFERVCADDVRMIQPQMPTIVGKRAFRERFVRPLFELIPDIHATVHDWAASGDVIFISFTLEGTIGGNRVSWPCVDRIVLREGLAAERRAYFDPTSILRAVATRPRAWPKFLRLQATQLFQYRTKGN
ncbi:MAG: nuclear transport factor 2 family protein [Solirubrobacterales bacterium]